MEKCFLKCFNRDFFTNQVTNVLTEVVPFCKSGHTYTSYIKHSCYASGTTSDVSYCI